MPAKVKKVKARKDYPKFGILKGEEHYTWQLWYGGYSVVYRSKTYPRASRLETSEYMVSYLELVERAQDLVDSGEVSQDDIDSLIADIQELQSDVQSKLDNMPEPLQEGETGQLMQSRIDELDTWLDALCAIESENLEDPDQPEDNVRAEKLQEAMP